MDDKVNSLENKIASFREVYPDGGFTLADGSYTTVEDFVALCDDLGLYDVGGSSDIGDTK